MFRAVPILALLCVLACAEEARSGPSKEARASAKPGAVLSLPRVALPETPLLTLLSTRQSRRAFGKGALTREQLAALLWAGQGKTRRGRRTAPSAGALYPLDLYLVATQVHGLAPGVYRYVSASHQLVLVRGGAQRAALHRAVRQGAVKRAPATIVVTATPARSTVKYGKRGLINYVPAEVGAVMQNIALAATALKLAGVYIGAFDEAAMQRALGLRAGERALACFPVGPLRR